MLLLALLFFCFFFSVWSWPSSQLSHTFINLHYIWLLWWALPHAYAPSEELWSVWYTSEHAISYTPDDDDYRDVTPVKGNHLQIVSISLSNMTCLTWKWPSTLPNKRKASSGKKNYSEKHSGAFISLQDH